MPQNRVNTSINSYTQIGISQLNNEIAQVNSQAAIVLAEAEQRARTTTASKTQTKSLDMLNLEVEADAIAKWDGHLSPIQPQPGQTIVLGGLFSDVVSDTVTKLPFLGDVPVLGSVFRNRQRSHTRDEVVFYITPHIL